MKHAYEIFSSYYAFRFSICISVNRENEKKSSCYENLCFMYEHHPHAANYELNNKTMDCHDDVN